MKKRGFLLLIVAAVWLMSPASSSAQVNINFNISSQPLWGPVSYDYVEYYYLPEYDIYYYAPGAQFVYLSGNNWVFSTSLPYRYRHANLYSTYKVVINEPRPYLRNAYYVDHYKAYRHSHPKQVCIRDSRDERYYGNKNHPMNHNFHQEHNPHDQYYKSSSQSYHGNDKQWHHNDHESNRGHENKGGGEKHRK
jgi:hypothetical protein